MRRTEATQSVRIRQSDYDLLIGLMERHGLQTVTAAVTFALDHYRKA